MQQPDFYAYPAIFSTDGDGWEVAFPDVDNAFTAADSLEEAILEARHVLEDIMYLREREGDDIPAPTPLHKVRAGKNDLVQLVVASMADTRRQFRQRAVKKTLTIPAWMDEELKKHDEINVSRLLQDAIKQELRLN